MSRRFHIVIYFILLFVCISAAQSQTPRQPWQQRVDYKIDISLNDVEHTLDGFVRMQYHNNSPDTLRYIWMHCWPNAYKSDRTAFSEQLLANGRTDFYFSDPSQRGYINRLDFRVDGQAAPTEDHPLYIDIVKITLPKLLAPGAEALITTPFHEQLPDNFSRGGHVGHTYQLTQWYPKPAVYDRTGWHEMPYLDQGEFYSEFGNYDVRITLPEKYIVAATGQVQPDSSIAEGDIETTPLPVQPKRSLPIKRTQPKYGATKRKTNLNSTTTPQSVSAKRKPSPDSTTNSQSIATQHEPGAPPPNSPSAAKSIASRPGAPKKSHSSSRAPIRNRTLHYIQDNIHDFAIFADPRFHIDHDTIQLPSGKIIDAYAYYIPAKGNSIWRNSIAYIKSTIQFRSRLIGDYPYSVVSVAETATGTLAGMEYPTITSIPVQTQTTAKDLDLLIGHEVGHNWFYGALANNERRYPWMDEGMNTYYDHRYERAKYGAPKRSDELLLRMLPPDPNPLFIDSRAALHIDQPISTSSEAFAKANYDLIAYDKAGSWMQQLETQLGADQFDKAMQAYYQQWQFRHPGPEDFRASLENSTGQNLQTQFAKLDTTGPVGPPRHRSLRPAFFFDARHTDRYNYINLFPAIGYNKYDGAMIGALIHNYDLPPNKFQFLLAPLYGTNSHQFEGLGRISYNWDPNLQTGIAASRFSAVSALDSNGKRLFGGFYKIAPFIRFNFPQASLRSTRGSWLEWKTFLIGERDPSGYTRAGPDSVAFPTKLTKYEFRYLNQLSFHIGDTRVLYPYAAWLQVQQADRFYRINFTGNYFYNYASGGGLDLRLFAAKFGYLGGQGTNLNLSRFQPKLTAVSGDEDYTYSNYFFGRNQFDGFASQQMMVRDGALKIRVPNFPFLEGRSDNWVTALNLRTTLPRSIVPEWLPLRLFFDIGTYAGAWQQNALTSHFLYVGGLQYSFMHDMIHFYIPLVYSSEFSDQLKTLPEKNTFWKKISFSVDIQDFNFRKFVRNTPL